MTRVTLAFLMRKAQIKWRVTPTEEREKDAMAKGQQRSNKEKKKPKQDKKKIAAATPTTSIGQGGKPAQSSGSKKGR